jgi:hypothetical protein
MLPVTMSTDSGGFSITFGEIVAAVMFIGGLVAGPGYWMYSRTKSGTLLDPQEIRYLPNGFRTLTTTLTPDMNPIGMAISASYYGSPHERNAYIGVAVRDGKSQLAQGTAPFKPEAEKDKEKGGLNVQLARSTRGTVFIDTFSVPHAGNYEFHFNGTRPQESGTVRWSDARLELRRNMKPANMKIVWTGTGVLVFSLLFGWMMVPARVEN